MLLYHYLNMVGTTQILENGAKQLEIILSCKKQR